MNMHIKRVDCLCNSINQSFLKPGFSYRKVLIAYGSVQTKFYFSYEFVKDLTKLQSGLLEHQDFYYSLSKSNITKKNMSL